MLLQFISAIILILTIVGFYRRRWWLSIIDYFRLQYAVIALILLIPSLLNLNIAAIIINIMIIIINTKRIRKFLPRTTKTTDYTNKDILSVNAFKDNLNPEEIKKTLKLANPNILLIMEFTDDLKECLGPVLFKYKHQMITPVRDGFSIALFSKTPLEKKHISFHGPNDTPLLQAQTIINKKKFHIFSAHPRPALNAQWFSERQIYFEEISSLIANIKGPTIVLGDFNSVPWENHFKAFLSKTNLKSTMENQGYKITWPTFFPFVGVPMDHILFSKDVQFHNLHVGPYSGSDHYPISININHNGTN